MIDENLIAILNKGCLDPNAFTELNFLKQEECCDYNKLNMTITQRNVHWRELLRRLFIKLIEEFDPDKTHHDYVSVLPELDKRENFYYILKDSLDLQNGEIFFYNSEIKENGYINFIDNFLENQIVSTVKRNLNLRSTLFYDNDDKSLESGIDGTLKDLRDKGKFVKILINDDDLIFKQKEQIKIPIKLVEDITNNPIPYELLYIEVFDSKYNQLHEKSVVLTTNEDGECWYLRADYPIESDINDKIYSNGYYVYYLKINFIGNSEDGYYSSSLKTQLRIKV